VADFKAEQKKSRVSKQANQSEVDLRVYRLSIHCDDAAVRPKWKRRVPRPHKINLELPAFSQAEAYEIVGSVGLSKIVIFERERESDLTFVKASPKTNRANQNCVAKNQTKSMKNILWLKCMIFVKIEH